MKKIAVKLRGLVFATLIEGSVFLEGRTVDEALDLRDELPFDSEWVRAYELVVAAAGVDPDALRDIEDEIFQAVYRAYESSELSACVSEDIGLLARAAASGVEDPWLNALWRSYSKGRFPTGALAVEQGILCDLINA